MKTDLTKLSRRQKLQILEKESPELFSLIEDYKSMWSIFLFTRNANSSFLGKMTLAKDYLFPIMKKHKDGDLPKSKAVDFVKSQYGIILK